MTTYLITIDDFQSKADITANIKTSKLQAYIGVTQEKYGLKILCKEFYDEIIDQVCNGTLTAANTTLIPYIKDYLIYKTYERYLVNANILSTPGGLRVQNDTTSREASADDLAPLRNQAKSDANFYQDQLINFLILNESDYTTWKNSPCNCNPKSYAYMENKFTKVGKSYEKIPIKWT